MEANAPSRIRWDWVNEPDAVKAIINTTVEGPDAPMEVNACNAKVCKILQIKPLPGKMTVQDWTEAQKADPVLGQVVIFFRREA